MTGYLIVMAIMALAIVAVLIAVFTGCDDKSDDVSASEEHQPKQ